MKPRYREALWWIDGQPPRKSNQRQIVGGSRPRLIKSRQALAWRDWALTQLNGKAPQDGPFGSKADLVSARFLVFYKSNRSDLSVELVQDVLEEADILANDRYIFHVVMSKMLCNTRQGVAVWLQERPALEWLSTASPASPMSMILGWWASKAIEDWPSQEDREAMIETSKSAVVYEQKREAERIRDARKKEETSTE